IRRPPAAEDPRPRSGSSLSFRPLGSQSLEGGKEALPAGAPRQSCARRLRPRSLQLRDLLQLFPLAEPVEPPGLAPEVGPARRPQEALFQPPAIPVGQLAGRPVAFGLLGREALGQAVAAEDQL